MFKVPATIAVSVIAWLCLLAPAAVADSGPEEVAAAARAIASAAAHRRPWPRLEVLLPGADLATAARVQDRLPALADGAPVAGYKAAFTAAALRSRFGLDAPMLGILPAAALREPGAELVLAPARQPMLEVELAWRLARDVTAVPDDDAALEALFDAVVPCLEIPVVAFAGDGPPGAADLLAVNTAVHGFVPAVLAPLPAARAGQVPLVLRHDGAIVARASGDALEDGQRAARRFMLARVLAMGRTPRAGQWLLTGALAGMTPAAPGVWTLEADGVEALRLRIHMAQPALQDALRSR